MVCYAGKHNLLKPSRGNPGSRPHCVATLFGFYFGTDNMKKIPLTRGCFATVDDKDYAALAKYKWQVLNGRAGNKYAIRTPSNQKAGELMHRSIIKPPEGYETDHINGNGLDNRRENLRMVTRSQNNQNRRKSHKKCSSKYKGVSLDKRCGRWGAYINSRKQRQRLGYHDTEELAAKAYDIKAAELFGEFALLNRDMFPELRT